MASVALFVLSFPERGIDCHLSIQQAGFAAPLRFSLHAALFEG